MSATVNTAQALPRVGMLATVRNRQGLISAVEPGPTTEHGRVHLVRVEYFDAEGPSEETLAWEREPGARVLEPTALPRVGEVDPMPGDELDALVRATRWYVVNMNAVLGIVRSKHERGFGHRASSRRACRIMGERPNGLG